VLESIGRIRTKLANNINMPGNTNGCLRGTVDDYLESFDDHIERLKAQFATTREYWQNQAAG